MDAFTVLAELAGVQLTADQMAQVRAINTRYYTALFRLRQSEAAGRDGGAGVAHTGTGDELHARLRADVLAVLTPAQRQAMRGG